MTDDVASPREILAVLAKLIRDGIGLATFLRTPSELIHPVLSLETLMDFEKKNIRVDLETLDFVLDHIRETRSLNPPN